MYLLVEFVLLLVADFLEGGLLFKAHFLNQLFVGRLPFLL